ncbi:MAG: hypothetical protein Metus_0742 [Candidatus Methanosuratincola subterraneus]|uniref:CBM-cenC domain-containing protein n=1 Tax=Methanosuratincola subterraneus TaxID=2593994 RepID=A0A444L8R3_METS7|nr:MAG: hypothetical protein Metus_0742 [Candidatus Methanosuratincola subterraneus]
MKAKTIILLASALFIAGAIAALYPQAHFPSERLTEGFETGFGGWDPDADVPIDPNTGGPVDWDVARSTDVSRSGMYSMKLFIDGRQDDGAVWIERKLLLKEGARRVNITFGLYSQSESFNTIAVVCAYAGFEDPEREGDLSVLAPANEVAGWKRYSLVVNIDGGKAQELWVAAGISVRWETCMTYYLDDITVEVT